MQLAAVKIFLVIYFKEQNNNSTSVEHSQIFRACDSAMTC